MSTLTIKTARAFEPLLHPKRYKGAHGGRGSGKSHFFAELLVEDAIRIPGFRAVCIREVQKSLAESAKRLIEDKIAAMGVGSMFNVLKSEINTPGGGVILFQGMQDHTAESIKSLEGMDRAWVEEAQTLSDRSWRMLRPTIRKESSEIWASWNARLKTDPVDKFFRGPSAKADTAIACVQANWRDNPWFPEVLELERQRDLKHDPDAYPHVWEGEYVTILAGAYYASALKQAEKEGRVDFVARDPNLRIHAIWDIGGPGKKADAMTIVIAQFIGQKINVLDYCEGVGQVLGYYTEWLRERGWEKAYCVVPHDAAQTHADNPTGIDFEAQLKQAGFQTRKIHSPPGIVMQRIATTRRLFPKIWFNKDKTEGLRAALGWYHEKRDEERGIGLGPEHDWASHGCFHGDTEVLTRYGTRPIKSLPFTGEILTPCGWKQYVAPRITLKDAPLVEVRFSDGHTVKCTADHLFLTDSGWKSAESLQRGSLIQSTLTPSRSISMAVSTACGRVSDICRAAANAFTSMFGRQHSVPFLAGVTFTTGTRTFSTIQSPISNACRRENIWSTPPSGDRKRVRIPALARWLVNELLSGIPLKRAAFGTAATPSELSRGRNGSASPAIAPSAASSLTRSSERAGMLKFTAGRPARSQRIESAGKQMPTLLRIESVKKLSETADVWDITVPDGHWFSLANGAVVHNSDAFGLMCIAYEEPRATVKKLDIPSFGAV